MFAWFSVVGFLVNSNGQTHDKPHCCISLNVFTHSCLFWQNRSMEKQCHNEKDTLKWWFFFIKAAHVIIHYAILIYMYVNNKWSLHIINNVRLWNPLSWNLAIHCIAFIWVIDVQSIYEFIVIVVWVIVDTVWMLHVSAKACVIKHMDILYSTLYFPVVCVLFCFIYLLHILSLIRLLGVVHWC